MSQASVLGDRIRDLRSSRRQTILVALDGGSGAGKSTLARAVGAEHGAAVIDGDDFYAGGSAAEWDAMTAAEKAAHCIDWRRQRPVLETLAQGRPASWHPYDWEIDDSRLLQHATDCQPAPVAILEGVYSARPELADLFDLRVLCDTPAEIRRQRIVERDGGHHRADWNRRWEEAEQWYFGRVMPPERFDLVLPAQ